MENETKMVYFLSIAICGLYKGSFSLSANWQTSTIGDNALKAKISHDMLLISQ